MNDEIKRIFFLLKHLSEIDVKSPLMLKQHFAIRFCFSLSNFFFFSHLCCIFSLFLFISSSLSFRLMTTAIRSNMNELWSEGMREEII